MQEIRSTSSNLEHHVRSYIPIGCLPTFTGKITPKVGKYSIPSDPMVRSMTGASTLNLTNIDGFLITDPSCVLGITDYCPMFVSPRSYSQFSRTVTIEPSKEVLQGPCYFELQLL